MSFLWGTIAEWWAAPRVLAVGTLQALFWVGHAPDKAARMQRWVEDAVRSGQPAVDYIGIGGGLWLSEVSPDSDTRS